MKTVEVWAGGDRGISHLADEKLMTIREEDWFGNYTGTKLWASSSTMQRLAEDNEEIAAYLQTSEGSASRWCWFFQGSPNRLYFERAGDWRVRATAANGDEETVATFTVR